MKRNFAYEESDSSHGYINIIWKLVTYLSIHMRLYLMDNMFPLEIFKDQIEYSFSWQQYQ